MTDSTPATAAGRPPLPPPNPLLGFVACECGGSHDFRDHPDEPIATAALPPDYWRIRAALVEAVELIADLMPYAGGYFTEKHGYDKELAALRAVLERTPTSD